MTKKKTTTKKKELTFGEVWETLNAINVDKYLNKKGKYPYLPWSNAWAILMEHYPQATFENHKNDMEYPCFFDPSGFGMVSVTVKIDGLERTEDYAVTDNNYNAVQNPDPDLVNSNLKRCLVKCLAYFGLGQYVFRNAEAPQDADPLDENFNRDHAVAVVNKYHENGGGDEWLLKVLEHFTASKLGDLTNEQLQQVVKRIESKQNKGDS